MYAHSQTLGWLVQTALVSRSPNRSTVVNRKSLSMFCSGRCIWKICNTSEYPRRVLFVVKQNDVQDDI